MADGVSFPFWPAELSLRSLRGRMALLLGVLLSPAGALAVQAGLSALSLREVAVQREVGAVILNDMDAQRNQIARLREVTRTVAANSDVVRAAPANCGQTLRAVRSRFQDFAAIAVIDARTRVQCASDAALAGRSLQVGPLIEDALRRNGVALGFMPRTSPRGENMIAAVAPFAGNGPDRRFAIALGEGRVLLMRSGNQAARPGGFSALVDSAGHILETDGLTPGAEETTALARVLAQGPMHGRIAPFRVAHSWAVATDLHDETLFLVQGWRAPPLTAGAALRAGWAVGAPLMMWLLAVAAVWIAVEVYVTRPLSTLETVARAYARGDDSVGPAAFRTAPEEIASLRRTLAAMAKTLRGREQALALALEEERALLREVNHRVMNNLQIMASILSIQARTSESEEQAWGLARALDRVQLLSLAHSKIYRSGALREIALDDFISEIGRTLVSSRGPEAENIDLEMSLAQASTTIDNAVPLAFLIGESLSRALDVLVGGAPATIQLTLNVLSNVELEFTIAAPAKSASDAQASTTRRMIEAFARQLNAKIDFEPDEELFTRIRFAQGAATDV